MLSAEVKRRGEETFFSLPGWGGNRYCEKAGGEDGKSGVRGGGNKEKGGP